MPMSESRLPQSVDFSPACSSRVELVTRKQPCKNYCDGAPAGPDFESSGFSAPQLQTLSVCRIPWSRLQKAPLQFLREEGQEIAK